MRLEVLLNGLKNPDAAVRLDVVRVLGMLDEVRALPVVRELYQAESDPTVRSAAAWAGKRLYQAQQANYSTVEEIFRHFGVDREIENTPDAAEAALVQKMKDDLDAALLDSRARAARRQAGLAAAAGIGVGMLAGGSMGLSAMAGGLSAGAGVASSNLGESDRPRLGTSRAPATVPSTADISVWVRRLCEGKNVSQREQAAIELAQLNNPMALPHLAAAFTNDPSAQVRQAAQRFGKVLYWSTVYWEMEQDGSLQCEIDRRLEEMGKRTEKPVVPPGGQVQQQGPFASPADAPAAEANQEVDVAEILRKARKSRESRHRRG
jgi:hypothetical protein